METLGQQVFHDEQERFVGDSQQSIRVNRVLIFHWKHLLFKSKEVGTAGARSLTLLLVLWRFFGTLRETADKLKSFCRQKRVAALFTSIAFYIGEKVLGLNDREYPLGELTAEVLNISPEEYHELHRIMGGAMENMDRYEKISRCRTGSTPTREMIWLHESLIRYRIFA